MAAAKKAFAKLTTAFAAAPRWTLGHFKAHLKEGMDKESWKTMLPGVRGSAQVAEMKDSMKVLDALQSDELDGRHRVEGLRPNVAYCARARRDNGSWGPPSRVLRCSGGAPSWFEAWRHKRRRRKESKIEVLGFACVANRLDADVQDLLRLIHEYLAP